MMKRLAVASALMLALAMPAQAKIPLSDLSGYLNAMTSAKGGFTQINSDQTISEGKIFIRRPGRVRFEYAPPDRSLVISGGSQVAIFDPKSNQPPEQYPLSRTPLSLILAKDVRLNRSNMVVSHVEDGPATVLTVQDPEHPEYGNIQLKFTDNPVQLRQWVITNDVGDQTTVILRDLKASASLAPILFDITAETRKRK